MAQLLVTAIVVIALLTSGAMITTGFVTPAYADDGDGGE